MLINTSFKRSVANNMYLYKTAYEYGEAEYVIEKSRFIAHVQPVSNYEEAQKFVSDIKQKYKDATHNVPAIVCGPKQEMQWASDDGEPSGTSGLPMLKMITDEGLTNLAVVVTRYFGGIKLGTGGLSRAYTTAAKMGLESSGICEIREGCLLTYTFNYSSLDKLQNLARDGRFEIKDIEYADKVKSTLSCMLENVSDIKSMMDDLTSGQAVLTAEENALNKYKI